MFLKWVDKHLKVLFIAPCLIFVVLMIAFPLIYNFALSFCQWSMSNIQPPEFVGLGNYISLFQDERFWKAVGRTVYFVVVVLTAETLLGVALAVMINRMFHGKRLAQTLFLLPVVATPVAVGMVWMLMYEPTIGFANVVLLALGIPAQEFLGSPSQALLSLAVVDIWEWTPMVMLMVYAGLTAIPNDPYESALIDGATSWQKFTKITLPLASPTILVAMLLRLIDAIKTFDIIYATTKGGPGFATENINILAYTTSFSYFEFGRAAAITVLFFIVVIAISVGFMQVKKKVEVEF